MAADEYPAGMDSRGVFPRHRRRPPMTVPMPPRYQTKQLPIELQRGENKFAIFDSFLQSWCSVPASKMAAESIAVRPIDATRPACAKGADQPVRSSSVAPTGAPCGAASLPPAPTAPAGRAAGVSPAPGRAAGSLPPTAPPASVSPAGAPLGILDPARPSQKIFQEFRRGCGVPGRQQSPPPGGRLQPTFLLDELWIRLGTACASPITCRPGLATASRSASSFTIAASVICSNKIGPPPAPVSSSRCASPYCFGAHFCINRQRVSTRSLERWTNS